ncbi:unnamed protein product [Urochloa humidicola]
MQEITVGSSGAPWPSATLFRGKSTHEAAAPGCIVLCDNQCDADYIGTFSVDTRNIELKRVQKLYRLGGRPFPYELPWTWTISACL